MVLLTRRQQTLGFFWLAFELLLLPSLLTSVSGFLPVRPDGAVLNFVFYLINFLAVLLIFRDALGDSLRSACRNPRGLLLAVLPTLAVYYAAQGLLGLLFVRLDPGFFNVNDAGLALQVREHPLLMAIGTVLLVPPAEECLFRGLLLGGSRPVGGRAVACSVLLFSAIHVLGYVGRFPTLRLLLCFVQYLPAGLCLCLSYVRSETLLAPILLHAAVNAVSLHSLF